MEAGRKLGARYFGSGRSTDSAGVDAGSSGTKFRAGASDRLRFQCNETRISDDVERVGGNIVQRAEFKWFASVFGGHWRGSGKMGNVRARVRAGLRCGNDSGKLHTFWGPRAYSGIFPESFFP